MEGDTNSKRRSILVPLDGSPNGEWALPLAVGLGRRSGARVRLAAVEQPYPVSYRQVLLKPTLWARKYLSDVRERIRATGFEDVDVAVLAGEVVPALEAYAQRVNPELVIMATHGRGTLSRLWLGSVTDGFIRCSRSPVLVVRPGEQEGPGGLEREPELARFLVTLDGSSTSEAVLEPALRLRELTGAHLTLLRVVQFPPEDPPPFHRGPGPVDPVILDGLRGDAEQYMDRIVGELTSRGVPATGVVQVAERPSDAILEASRERPVDLIAMGTEGRGALGRFMVGSVADKVVRSATVPVLLVRNLGGAPE